MRGHVYKRGNGWTVVYDEGRDETGKRIQRSKGGFHTRRDAQRFLTETLGRLGDGSYAAPSKLTLGEFLTGEWLPAIEGTLRPLSVTQYQSVVRNRIVPRIGGLRLQGVSGAHLNALLRELEEAGLSAASRRQTYAVLSRAFRDAVRWGRLVRNPAVAADPPAVSEQRATAWTAKELTRFLEHVGDDRLSALWRLAATTGLRRGELLGATWLALDTAGGTLRVDQQALNEHRDAQLLERAFAGDAYVDRDLLFCDELGNPIYPQRLTEAFLGHRDAAKIPSGTLHVLRHTHATLALTNGVPLHVVAARLGDRPETLLRTYAHLLPQSDVQAAEQVAALIA